MEGYSGHRSAAARVAMSALPALAVVSPTPPPSPESMPVLWARVVGFGPYSPDAFGHHIATNAAGEALISAHLERARGDAGEEHGESAEHADNGDETRDLSTAQIVKVGPDGRRAWRLPLRAARLLRPPSVALDDHGCAYIAG